MSVPRSLIHAACAALLAAATLGFAQAAPSSTPTADTVPMAPNGRPAMVIAQQGTLLPIYRFIKPNVSDDSALLLAQRFSNIYNRQNVEQSPYLNNSRFTVPNPDTTSLLEQYGATGGFYAYNPNQAFGDIQRGKIDVDVAKRQACNFLNQRELTPNNARTAVGSCPNIELDSDIPFDVTEIHRTIQQNTPGAAAVDTVVGAVVKVPMFVQISRANFVEIGGAGGHLSLMFRTTSDDGGFTLDQTVPGLAAVAMPFYGRAGEFLRSAPARGVGTAKEEVLAVVRSTFPNAENIELPDPTLRYMVDDAAVEQDVLEPKLVFANIQVTVDGQTFNLRDVSVPAVEGGAEGFGPTVQITSPASGSTFTPGQPIQLTGSITHGTGPYDYAWTLEDETVLKTGSVPSAGTVGIAPDNLPAVGRDGRPAPLVVRLSVTDAEGATRSTQISLTPAVAPALFLPLVQKIGTATAQALPQAAQTQRAITISAINYSFGIEAGSDYPPYGAGGADLPGVVPDVNGFRSGMQSLGWAKVLDWANQNAYERDWRDCGISSGGDCVDGMDRFDFAYYAGHGGPGGLSMPSNVNSTWASAENARFQRLRWVGFASCQTLRAQPNTTSAPIRRWFNSFQGAHMLLGFNSNMADVAFGGRLVDNMRIPTFPFIGELPWAQRTINEAWVQTAFQLNAGKPAYIYAIGTNGVNPVNNRLPRATDPLLPRPFPAASYHWVWWNE